MNSAEIKLKFLNYKTQYNTVAFRKVFKCEDFNKPNKVMRRMPDYQEYLDAKAKIKKPDNVGAEQIPLYQEPLLTRGQEYHLFCQYNYLKSKCLQFFEKSEIEVYDFHKLERYLTQIADIKRIVVSANTRLAFKVAKIKQYSDFDSAVSDTYFALVFGVDYFNYLLNNRFSTYVWWVMVDVMRKGSFSERVFRDLLIGNDEVIDVNTAHMDTEEKEDETNNIINRLLNTITPRERDIIKYYYGLGNRKEMCLDEISNIMKISRERVRQIKIDGLQRIKQIYEDEESRGLHSIEDSPIRQLQGFKP